MPALALPVSIPQLLKKYLLPYIQGQTVVGAILLRSVIARPQQEQQSHAQQQSLHAGIIICILLLHGLFSGFGAWLVNHFLSAGLDQKQSYMVPFLSTFLGVASLFALTYPVMLQRLSAGRIVTMHQPRAFWVLFDYWLRAGCTILVAATFSYGQGTSSSVKIKLTGIDYLVGVSAFEIVVFVLVMGFRLLSLLS